jgi:CelD/BcsL family acetyltransferase involved in cellulose biosynthesis
VTATVVRTPSVEGLRREWDDLAARVDASPFACPGWTAAWERAFAPRGVEVLTVRRDAELVAVVPVRRRTGLLAAAANVHSPELPALTLDADAARELAEVLMGQAPAALSLTMADPEGDLAREVRAAARARGRRVVERTLQRSPLVELDGSWDQYAATRGRSLLADLRRRSRRLEERGEVTVTEATAAETSTAFAELSALEAAGWKGARGTAMASRPATRRFYAEVAAWAADRGTLRLALLRLDGRPLAGLLGLEESGVHYLLKCAYDPAEAAFSPVKLLLRDAVQRAFARGLRRIELLGAAEPYKLQWATGSRPRIALEVFSGSPTGRAAWAAAAYGRPLAKRAGLAPVVARLRRI